MNGLTTTPYDANSSTAPFVIGVTSPTYRGENVYESLQKTHPEAGEITVVSATTPAEIITKVTARIEEARQILGDRELIVALDDNSIRIIDQIRKAINPEKYDINNVEFAVIQN